MDILRQYLTLISKGDDIGIMNNESKTALDIAKSENREEVVRVVEAKIAEKQNKEAIIVKAFTDIVYDNELLNHPDLLKELLKAFDFNQIIDRSLNLDQGLIEEAISNGDSSLMLAGLISLTEENIYE